MVIGSLVLGFLTSFFVVLFIVPSLIKVAELKNLYDEPGDDRKLHSKKIPSIGGIIIFAATLFSYSLWYPDDDIGKFKYIISSLLILFFVGAKDDIIGTAPVKKLLANFIVGLMLVLMANIRITSLHGIFGVLEIPYWASVFLSLFTYVVIINSLNLIDGVDGLASGVGIVATVSFGTWFYISGSDLLMASLAFSLAGALFAFLFFNFSPARIFMGDSGSLTIGLIIAILAFELIEYDKADLPTELMGISKPVFAIAVLIYPLLDVFRIFMYRTIKGLSPFNPDKKHIHHRLLLVGLNHRQTVITIYIYNVFIIGLCILTRNMDPSQSLMIVLGTAMMLVQIPFFLKKKEKIN
ncbi:MAG: undecaprenyl/decaprenyl-phosphate alpha-N-acetylglucosaminyl 1-phosphate transferase [Flavobacteriales bacterium]|nr:undecaprenyl/decaprenyl-phosphate alpha-N-acetylglucosaminyl 1-phosphate transferase [Flavobacteriales bacterium]